MPHPKCQCGDDAVYIADGTLCCTQCTVIRDARDLYPLGASKYR